MVQCFLAAIKSLPLLLWPHQDIKGSSNENELPGSDDESVSTPLVNNSKPLGNCLLECSKTVHFSKCLCLIHASGRNYSNANTCLFMSWWDCVVQFALLHQLSRLCSGVMYFYASVPAIATAGRIVFSGWPSLHPSHSCEQISQKHLEGISSNLSQMSSWAQGWTD